ncbi:MAG: histone deacetylase, partial [Candidatus Aureabacteria bacterium]|nr:histone deacetylase [Candidatus Auribacterota bacterium]
EYLAAFNKVLVPAADAFKPEFVLISAGFDPHLDDPLTGLAVSTAGFARLTAIVMEIAARHCGGRLVSALEGGYHLENLAASAVAHVKTLMEK